MKIFLVLAVACLASTNAVHVLSKQNQRTQSVGRGVRDNLISGQQAVQLVCNSVHIVIVNKQNTGVAGYYVPVPNEIRTAVPSPTSAGSAQLIDQLRQNGILLIWNAQNYLAGLYAQSLGNNQPGNMNVSTLIQDLAGIDLNPIVNPQNQVIGLYTSSSSLTFTPNQDHLHQQWNQEIDKARNPTQKQNPSNQGQQQNPLNQRQQQNLSNQIPNHQNPSNQRQQQNPSNRKQQQNPSNQVQQQNPAEKTHQGHGIMDIVKRICNF